jgi:phosphopantetheinyl transferase
MVSEGSGTTSGTTVNRVLAMRSDKELPDAQFPDTEPPNTELPDAQFPDTEPPNTELPDAKLPDTTLPTNIFTAAGEVQLRWYRVSDFSEANLAELASLLTASERASVLRAKTETERQMRILARGILRQELARRTGISPALVPLEFSSTGKPHLEKTTSNGLTFNLAHSHDWVVQAFARGFEVGVDLEHVDPNNVIGDQIVMTDDERQALAALPEPKRLKAFFQQWVAQEAAAKAAGMGLAAFCDLGTGNLKAQALHNQSWQVIPINAPPGFVAALATPAMSTVHFGVNEANI